MDTSKLDLRTAVAQLTGLKDRLPRKPDGSLAPPSIADAGDFPDALRDLELLDGITRALGKAMEAETAPCKVSQSKLRHFIHLSEPLHHRTSKQDHDSYVHAMLRCMYRVARNRFILVKDERSISVRPNLPPPRPPEPEHIAGRPLIHLVPKFYSCFGNADRIALVDLKIEPYGLLLRGGIDLATRRPYPNKNFAVACRNEGRAAVNGILLRVPELVDFTYTARWAIEASYVSTHTVVHRILDQDFNAVTDAMELWWGCSPGLGGWESRRPAWIGDLSPAAAQPLMELAHVKQKRPNTVDKYESTGNGWLKERVQTFDVPTIEPGRLQNVQLDDRLPCFFSAFSVEAIPSSPPMR